MARPKTKTVEGGTNRLAYDITLDEKGNFILITLEYNPVTKQAMVKKSEILSDTLENAKYKFDVLTYKKLIKECK